MLIGLLIGLIVWLGTAGLYFAGVFADLDQTLSHTLYHERPLSDELVLVVIDDASMMEQELGSYLTWNRSYYGKVLEHINAAGASTVLFDIMFLGSSRNVSVDSLRGLAEDYPGVVEFTDQVVEFLGSVHPDDAFFASVLEQYSNVFLIKNTYGPLEFNGEAFEVQGELFPYSLFAEQAQVGFYNAISNEESKNQSIVYALPTHFLVDGAIQEHVDLQVARHYLGREEAFEMPRENGQMLINYAQKPYGFPMVSFSDVYYGRVGPEVFKDKLVLIGASAEILHDNHYTPMDPAKRMPGVEIHANAIQTILDEAYLRSLTGPEFLVLTGLLIFLSVAVFLYAPVWAGVGFLVLEGVFFPLYTQWAFNKGLISSLIWPVFAMVAAYLLVLAYRNFTEFSEKRRFKTAFSRYVSPDLVDRITENPEALKLGGERRKLTALFLDIENFTTLSERWEAQEVVRVINRYFDALAQVIMEHQGSVDKYEGDAIMALFGAPVASENHAQLACEAALRIQETVQALNTEMGLSLHIRVGLATGEAIVGNMGSSQRFDYTAMGDTVNTASRLEGANKFYRTGILVNPGTVEAAQGKIFFRQVDRVCLKGKDQAIGIYEVLSLNEQVSEQGRRVVEEWNQGLEAYQKGLWEEAENHFKRVLEQLPEDGPSQTLLARIAKLKLLPSTGWDGVWRFDAK